MVLVLYVFVCVLQIFIDNMIGGEDMVWVNVYCEDFMWVEFDEEVDKCYCYYLNFEYNQDCIEFFFWGIDVLLVVDKQVVVFIYLCYGWQEEVMQCVGFGYVEEIMCCDFVVVADVCSYFFCLDNVCFDVGVLSVWDFVGFCLIFMIFLFDESGEYFNFWFYEFLYYCDIVGESIMSWLVGILFENGVLYEDFGECFIIEIVDFVIVGLYVCCEVWLGQMDDLWVEYFNGWFDELDVNLFFLEVQLSIFFIFSQWLLLNLVVECIEWVNVD